MITTTSDILIVAMARLPMIDTQQSYNSAIEMGMNLIGICPQLDYRDRSALLTFVWMIAKIMNVRELLEDPVISELAEENELESLYQPELYESIRDMALIDHRGYWTLIVPFAQIAGAGDVDDALEELEILDELAAGGWENE